MKRSKFALLLALFMGVSTLSGCFLDSLLKPTEQSQKDDQKKEDEKPAGDDKTGEDDDELDNNNRHLEVLFLGNSLMFFNDLPEMFEEMATIAGKDINVDSVTQGSATICQFADPTYTLGQQCRNKMNKQNWDYIVISPSRRASPWETTVYDAEAAAAETMNVLAQECGAKLLIYSVWGNNTGNLDIYRQTGTSTTEKIGNQPISRKQHTKFLHDFGNDIAEAVECDVIEAGYAFENAIATDPSLNLYYSDDKHPSLEGSYLAALTCYGTIYKDTNEYMSYDKGLAKANVLKDVANKTCLEGLVPDLEDHPEDNPDPTSEFNLLCVGSDFMPQHSVQKMFTNLALKADNVQVNIDWITSSNYTNRQVSRSTTTQGQELRTKLGSKDYDAVMFQVSRRCTKSSSDVEQGEKDAIVSIKEELFSELDSPKMYIYTMQSSENPAKFKDDGSDVYTKAGSNESYSRKVGTDYFYDIAADWAEAIEGDVTLYGSAIIDFQEKYTSGADASGAEMGYMKACCFYNSLFKKEIPSTCDYFYTLTEEVGKNIRTIAANWHLSA